MRRFPPFPTVHRPTLAIGLALALLAALPAQAAQQTSQSDNGTVKLNANVDTACTVAVTDLDVPLDIVGGETNRQVGSIVENCNDGDGYTISVTSSNSGKLKSGNIGVNYSASYDGNSGNGAALSVRRSTALFDHTSGLTVTIPATATAIAGNYSDTLTITIRAK